MDQNKPRPFPDDREINKEIVEAETFTQAILAISEKYDVPLTGNYERWQDGQFLREIGDFVEDIRDAARRFPRD